MFKKIFSIVACVVMIGCSSHSHEPETQIASIEKSEYAIKKTTVIGELPIGKDATAIILNLIEIGNHEYLFYHKNIYGYTASGLCHFDDCKFCKNGGK